MKDETAKKVSEPITYNLTIKEWPINERPREKLLQYGANHLSDSELLAIIIRTGIKGCTALDLARRLLSENKSLSDISLLSIEQIKSYGIGESRAIAILATLEIAKRFNQAKNKERVQIKTPDDVVKYFGAKFKHLIQEEFWMFPLNSRNMVLEQKQVSKGILNASLVHPRECFREAIAQSAASVIFLHNHPSGYNQPSQEDLTITKQLVEAGKIIGISVIDHIIIAGDNYFSFADNKLIQ